MNRFCIIAAAALSLLGSLTSCDDNSDLVSNPGGALVSDRFTVVMDSSFTVTMRSQLNARVQSRTTTQLLGAITAPSYGTLHADFVAQLFPSNAIDTTGVTPERIDSIKLQLVFPKAGFVGDSLAPIGFQVYPLTKQLPYPIYSDFDPEGYYSTVAMGRGMFTAAGVSISDTVAGASYRYAYATLPRQFGIELFRKFKQDPLLFNDPYAFAQYFPGIYVRTSYGSGRVTRVEDARVVMYYHKIQKLTNSSGVEVDSLTNHFAYYMASAPEVVSNSCIDFKISDKISAMAQAGDAVIVSPAGRDVEMTFPILDVIANYKQQTAGALSVINSLTLSIPLDSIANGRGINPPSYLLMVLSKDKEKFFAQNQLPDNKTSFVATIDYPNMRYDFTGLEAYLSEMLKRNDISPEDYTFTLTPVSMVMENSASSSYYYYYSTSQSTLSGISPMITLPTMVQLHPDKAKLKLTFSKQSL